MYNEIFQDLVDIMHHDYAGYIDKKDWDNPKPYEEKIRSLENKDELTANEFSEIVADYLVDFKDPHLFFSLIKSSSHKEFDNGFRTRRYQDKLYVTTLTNETRLKLGDAILSLDQIPVLQLVEKHQREINEPKAEREDWRKVTLNYNIAEVMDTKGNIRTLELKKYEKTKYKQQHTIKQIENDTLLMTLSDFFDPTSIDHLLENYEEDLKKAKKLIIDVRTNLGGTSLAFTNVEKYLFPSGKNKIDFNFYNMKINCTERNADLIIKLIDEELEKNENEEYREGLKRWKEQSWEKYRGKGFVNFDKDSSNSEYEITGLASPENIIVLTDNYCGSAGDIFVYLCKQSPKVTVIGRPTMGVNDYSNLSRMVWNHQFELMYATSRLNQLDNRQRGAEQGIKPDIYIPWTPRHINKDIDMEEALRLLLEN